MARIQIFEGNIVLESTDAIVNAANETLLGGGGVDGAIHDAAGPELFKYFYESRQRCPSGEAVLSPGFRLPCKYIIHTVGPIWRGGNFGEAETLANCYRNCLALAAKQNCRSISFCCISTGVFGYPLVAATRIALATVKAWLDEHGSNMLVRFCCYTDEDFATYRKVADELGIHASFLDPKDEDGLQ